MKTFISSLLIVIVFLLAAAVYLFVKLPSAGENNVMPSKEVVMRIGGAVFRAEVADTAAARGQGLSGRASLDAESGMLFVFPASGAYRFTMQGMRFPLDFVWIHGGRVVGVTENAAPGIASIDPPGVADTVLEVNAGKVKEFGIKTGDGVDIQ